MNNLENTFIIGFLLLICVAGLYYVVEDTKTAGVTFDAESTNSLNQFGDNYNNLSTSQIYNTTNQTGLPSYDSVSPEFREAAESKGIIETFNTAWDIFVKFPAVALSSFTFIDNKTAEYVILIIEAFFGLMAIFALISLYKGLRGNTNN